MKERRNDTGVESKSEKSCVILEFQLSQVLVFALIDKGIKNFGRAFNTSTVLTDSFSLL